MYTHIQFFYNEGVSLLYMNTDWQTNPLKTRLPDYKTVYNLTLVNILKTGQGV